MPINKGDTVILIEADQIKLQPYVGQKWQVEAINLASCPEAAIISRGNLQATSYLKNLEAVPPAESPFTHGDLVKIIKPYTKINHRTCEKSMIGKLGKIRGYDSKIDFYCIKTSNGEMGWFPISSFIPADFKGEHFFYPMQEVKYRDKLVIISQTKKSKFNFGQLLLIDGSWIPSTDVEYLPTV